VIPLVEPTVASLIASADQGDTQAADALFTALYAELHRMAGRRLARDGRHLTLGTTTLLHETYLGMAQRDAAFPDQARFMAYAARVMRTLVIDHMRRRGAQKRGGDVEVVALETDVPGAVAAGVDLERLGEAVEALARLDPPLAPVVDLKFFCGFTFAEIAAMRGLSERTVQRHWEKARLFLHDSLEGGGAA
jgi:RNA polymerase sigma factor (TIGR02999 family)